MFTKNDSPKTRSSEGSKGGLLLLLVTSSVWASRVSKLSAADSAEHPYVESLDLKTETCLKCHPAKNQGKFVHTAVGMGCENCHQAASRDNQTTVTLRATGGNLCAKCHEIKQDLVQHGPYKAGQCLICHDPHAGDYQAQTRAAVSTLCLGCHMLNQPEAKVNPGAKIVTLLDGRVYDLALWKTAPKIGEGHTKNNAPRKASDQVTVNATGKVGAEINCLSCHDPHASKAEHLLHKAAEARGGADNLSPRYRRNSTVLNGIYQDAPVLQGSFCGGRL